MIAFTLLDTTASATPLQKLLANLAGVLLAILAFEAIVIAPTGRTLVSVTTLICLPGGWWLTSGRPNSGLARSALTAALILLGDAMSPIGETVEISSVVRLGENVATVAAALLLFHAINRILPTRTSRFRSLFEPTCT